MEGGVVSTQDAAIKLSGVLVFLLDGSKVLVTDHLDGQVVLALMEQSRHIEFPSHEGTFDGTQPLTVQIDVRLPVDAVKVQPQLVVLQVFGYFELIPVPEVRAEERL